MGLSIQIEEPTKQRHQMETEKKDKVRTKGHSVTMFD